ncbi:MAG: T9SS C-terminal target domain-containing protein, partial [Flavisolibacter sp.]|nr:T9SS C-terminal target domain-containing protein [Flavisolibacter sp.]
MNKLREFCIVAATSLLTVSCIKVNFNDELGGGGSTTNPDDPNQSRVLVGSYERDIALTGGVYTIKGYVYFAPGTKLSIPAGTILKSDVSQKGAVIIERGARIEALGTAAQPIIFTSGKPVGQRTRGDWGGIILLGNAPTNRPLSPAPLIEGGVDRRYGGTVANDNSGTMRYVRIEWAGIAAEPGSEINGLTMGGVGS